MTGPATITAERVGRIRKTWWGWDDVRSAYKVQIGTHELTIGYAWSPDNGRGDAAVIGDATETANLLCEAWNARLAARAEPPAHAWQPIETAPRDGTRFLAYEDADIYALEWCPEMPGDGGYWRSFCGQYVTETPEPTHWQPLPAPPALAPTGPRP